MNGIYFYEGISFFNKENIGIETKIKKQIDSLSNIGEIKIVNAILNNSLIDRILFLLPFITSKRELQRNKILSAVNEKTVFIYIRKPALTIKFYNLLRKIKRKNPNILIYMEIPTFPFHSEYRGLSRLNVLKSIPCEKKLHKVINKIITYSDDDFIWNIPTIKMSNCIDFKSIVPRSKDFKLKERTIRLTCVANFTYWHGIDRLINGIKNYKGDYSVILNLVGTGVEFLNLKKISINCNNIIFHGTKSGVQLTKIFDNTDIAVDALGRHRSGVFYNSSLKGKEYAARGIPIISAVKTEFDYCSDFSYYLSLPANDDDIDIQSIIDFYNKIYSNESPYEISKKIRNYSEKKFDYKYGFLKKMEEEIYHDKKNNK